MPRYCKFFKECGNRAAYKLPHANLSLCKDHFLSNLEKRVNTFIVKKHLIHPYKPEYSPYKEKILVAVSGGKDSQVLLYLFKKLFPEEEIEALYIELGIKSKNYSQDSSRIAAQMCEDLNVQSQ